MTIDNKRTLFLPLLFSLFVPSLSLSSLSHSKVAESSCHDAIIYQRMPVGTVLHTVHWEGLIKRHSSSLHSFSLAASQSLFSRLSSPFAFPFFSRFPFFSCPSLFSRLPSQFATLTVMKGSRITIHARTLALSIYPLAHGYLNFPSRSITPWK